MGRALNRQAAGNLRFGPGVTDEVRVRRANFNIAKAVPFQAMQVPRHGVVRGVDIEAEDIFDEVGDRPDPAPTDEIGWPQPSNVVGESDSLMVLLRVWHATTAVKYFSASAWATSRCPERVNPCWIMHGNGGQIW